MAAIVFTHSYTSALPAGGEVGGGGAGGVRARAGRRAGGSEGEARHGFQGAMINFVDGRVIALG